MTIEERLIKKYGETIHPELATWLLKDGFLVNGSVEGRQRDVDHRDIGEFYKRSKHDTTGFSGIYVEKFMRRGNIRMCCDSFGFNVELYGTPTESQRHTLAMLMNRAWHDGIPTLVEWHTRRGKTRSASWPMYLEYLDMCDSRRGR